MGVTTTKTNKPFNPRGNDQSPKGYNRAKLFSGKALDFDGVNDSVDIGQNLAFINTGDFTFLANAKFDVLSGDECIMGQGSAGAGLAVLALVNGNGFFRFAFYGDDLDWDEPVETGKWYSLAFTFNRTTKARAIYVNGQLAVSDVSTLTPNASINNFVIGKVPYSATYADAQITGVRAFNTALTAAQVADLYNNPEKVVPTGLESNLKLWLPMMEGAGTTAYDGSGNGNHGTISGATYVNGIGAPVAQSAVIDWNKGQNLYSYSEQFDESSYWDYTQIHAVDSTGNEAPDGSLTADKLIANTNTAFHHIGKGVTGITNGISYRLSVWAKAAGHDYILINTAGGSASGNAGPIVNLTNGSIAGSLNGEDYDATITDAGNGWYKIEYDFTSSGTTISIDYNQLPSASVTAYAGDNTKGVYLWGVSLRPASSGSTYVRTGATAQTSDVLLPQGLTTGRDITGVNLFENVRKQGALNLDGNSWGKVHPNNSFSFGTGAFSMEAWVKLEYVNTGSYANEIITLNDSDDFSIKTISTGMSFAVGSGVSLSHTITLDNSWAHIVGVRNADGSMKLYINAVEEESNAAGSSTASVPIDNPVRLGTDSNEASRTYKDQIAQPRIYNRALTAEEVQRSYDSNKNIYTNS